MARPKKAVQRKEVLKVYFTPEELVRVQALAGSKAVAVWVREQALGKSTTTTLKDPPVNASPCQVLAEPKSTRLGQRAVAKCDDCKRKGGGWAVPSCEKCN